MNIKGDGQGEITLVLTREITTDKKFNVAVFTFFGPMPTIASQLEVVEKEIGESEKQLEAVQRSIRLGSLTISERNNLKGEESSLKKEIKSYDKKRRDLQKENWKSAILSVLILGVVVLVYMYVTSVS